MKHSQSLSEYSNKLEEVKEEDHEHIEEENLLPMMQEEEKVKINEFLSKKIKTEGAIKPTNKSIITKNLSQHGSADLTPEVTTTQDFMAKINKIYNEKSTLNSMNFYFVFSIVVLLNILEVILNLGEKSELTAKIVLFKIKANLTFSLFLLVIYKYIPTKRHYQHSLNIFTTFIIFALFLTNSVLIHYLFYPQKKYEEAAHALLFERDIRVMNMAIILIYFRFEIKNRLLLIHFCSIFFFSTIYSLVYFRLGIWKYYEDFAETYIYIILLIIFVVIANFKNYFIKNEKNEKRKAIETEAAKIKEELVSVKQKLEDTFKTISRPETASKADELLMKLKYLKFQALVNLKNRTVSPNSGKRKYKRNSNFIITDTGGSYSPSKITKNNVSGMGENQQSKLY